MAGLRRFLFLIDADLSEGSLEWIQQNSEDFLRGFPLQNGRGYLLAKNQILFFNNFADGSGVRLSVQPIDESSENIKYLHQQLVKNSKPENSTPYSVTEPTWFAKGVGALGSYETHSPHEIRYELLKSSAKQVNFLQRQLSVEDSKALVSILDVAPFNLNEVDVSVHDFQKQIKKTDKAVLIDISAYQNLLNKINQSISRPEAFDLDDLESLKENKVNLEICIEKAGQHNRLANLINMDLTRFNSGVDLLKERVAVINNQIAGMLENKKHMEIPAEIKQYENIVSNLHKGINFIRSENKIPELSNHFNLLKNIEDVSKDLSNLKNRINNHNELVKIYDDISTKMSGWEENPGDDELKVYCFELKDIKEIAKTTHFYVDCETENDAVYSFIDGIKGLAKEAEAKLNKIVLLEKIRDFKGSITRLSEECGDISNFSLEEVNEKSSEMKEIIIQLKEIQKSNAKTATVYQKLQNQINRAERVSGELEVIKELREKEEIFKNLSNNSPCSSERGVNAVSSIESIILKINEVQSSFDDIEGLSPIEFKKGKSGEIFDSMKKDLNELKAELGAMKSNRCSLEINEESLKNKLWQYIGKTGENIQKLREHNESKKDNPLIELFNNFIYKIKVNINKQYKNSIRFFKDYPEAETQVGKTTYKPKREQRLNAGEQAIENLSIFATACKEKGEAAKSDNLPVPAAGAA